MQLETTRASVQHSTLAYRHQLTGHLHVVRSAAYNATRHHLVTADDYVVILWSLKKELRRVQLPIAIDKNQVQKISRQHTRPNVVGLHHITDLDLYVVCISDGTVNVLGPSLHHIASFFTNSPENNGRSFGKNSISTGQVLASIISQTQHALYLSVSDGYVSAWVFEDTQQSDNNTQQEHTVQLFDKTRSPIYADTAATAVPFVIAEKCIYRTASELENNETNFDDAPPLDLLRSSCAMLSFGEDKSLLFGGTAGGEIFAWDTEKETVVAFLETMKMDEVINKLTCLAFSPQESKLVIGYHDGAVVVLNVIQKKSDSNESAFSLHVVGSFDCHTGPVNSFVLSTRDVLFRGIITCGEDNQVVHWDAATRSICGKYKRVYRPPPATSIVAPNAELSTACTSFLLPLSVSVGSLSKQLLLVVAGEVLTVLEVHAPRSTFGMGLSSSMKSLGGNSQITTSTILYSEQLLATQLTNKILVHAIENGALICTIRHPSFDSNEQSELQQLKIMDKHNFHKKISTPMITAHYWVAELGVHCVAADDGTLFVTQDDKVMCTASKSRAGASRLHAPAVVLRVVPVANAATRASYVNESSGSEFGYRAMKPTKAEQVKFGSNTFGENGFGTNGATTKGVVQSGKDSSIGRKNLLPTRTRDERLQRRISQDSIPPQQKLDYFIFTGSTDGDLTLWKMKLVDVKVGNNEEGQSNCNRRVQSIVLMNTVQAHSGAIVAVHRITPPQGILNDQDRIAAETHVISVGIDGFIKIWDVHTLQMINFLRVRSDRTSGLDVQLPQTSPVHDNKLLETIEAENKKGIRLVPVSASCILTGLDVIVVGFENGIVQSWDLPNVRLQSRGQDVMMKSSALRRQLIEENSIRHTRPMSSHHSHARRVTSLTTFPPKVSSRFGIQHVLLSASLDHNVMVWTTDPVAKGTITMLHCLSFTEPVLCAHMSGPDPQSDILVTCASGLLRVADWPRVAKTKMEALMKRINITPRINNTNRNIIPEAAVTTKQNDVTSTSSDLHVPQRPETAEVSSAIIDLKPNAHLGSPVTLISTAQTSVSLGISPNGASKQNSEMGGGNVVLIHAPTPTLCDVSIDHMNRAADKQQLVEYRMNCTARSNQGCESGHTTARSHRRPFTPQELKSFRMTAENKAELMPEMAPGWNSRGSNEQQVAASLPLQQISRIFKRHVLPNRAQESIPSSSVFAMICCDPLKSLFGLSNTQRQAQIKYLVERWTSGTNHYTLADVLSILVDLQVFTGGTGNAYDDPNEIRTNYDDMGQRRVNVRYNTMGEKVREVVYLNAPQCPVPMREGNALVDWTAASERDSVYDQKRQNGFRDVDSRLQQQEHNRLYRIERPLPQDLHVIFKQHYDKHNRRSDEMKKVQFDLVGERERFTLGGMEQKQLMSPNAVLKVARTICHGFYLARMSVSAAKAIALETFIFQFECHRHGNVFLTAHRVMTLLNSICGATRFPLCRVLVHLLGLAMEKPLGPAAADLFSRVLQLIAELNRQGLDPTALASPGTVNVDRFVSAVFALLPTCAATKGCHTRQVVVLANRIALTTRELALLHTDNRYITAADDDTTRLVIDSEVAVEVVISKWKAWYASLSSPVNKSAKASYVGHLLLASDVHPTFTVNSTLPLFSPTRANQTPFNFDMPKSNNQSDDSVLPAVIATRPYFRAAEGNSLTPRTLRRLDIRKTALAKAKAAVEAAADMISRNEHIVPQVKSGSLATAGAHRMKHGLDSFQTSMQLALPQDLNNEDTSMARLRVNVKPHHPTTIVEDGEDQRRAHLTVQNLSISAGGNQGFRVDTQTSRVVAGPLSPLRKKEGEEMEDEQDHAPQFPSINLLSARHMLQEKDKDRAVKSVPAPSRGHNFGNRPKSAHVLGRSKIDVELDERPETRQGLVGVVEAKDRSRHAKMRVNWGDEYNPMAMVTKMPSLLAGRSRASLLLSAENNKNHLDDSDSDDSGEGENYMSRRLLRTFQVEDATKRMVDFHETRESTPMSYMGIEMLDQEEMEALTNEAEAAFLQHFGIPGAELIGDQAGRSTTPTSQTASYPKEETPTPSYTGSLGSTVGLFNLLKEEQSSRHSASRPSSSDRGSESTIGDEDTELDDSSLWRIVDSISRQSSQRSGELLDNSSRRSSMSSMDSFVSDMGKYDEDGAKMATALRRTLRRSSASTSAQPKRSSRMQNESPERIAHERSLIKDKMGLKHKAKIMQEEVSLGDESLLPDGGDVDMPENNGRLSYLGGRHAGDAVVDARDLQSRGGHFVVKKLRKVATLTPKNEDAETRASNAVATPDELKVIAVDKRNDEEANTTTDDSADQQNLGEDEGVQEDDDGDEEQEEQEQQDEEQQQENEQEQEAEAEEDEQVQEQEDEGIEQEEVQEQKQEQPDQQTDQNRGDPVEQVPDIIKNVKHPKRRNPILMVLPSNGLTPKKGLSKKTSKNDSSIDVVPAANGDEKVERKTETETPSADSLKRKSRKSNSKAKKRSTSAKRNSLVEVRPEITAPVGYIIDDPNKAAREGEGEATYKSKRGGKSVQNEKAGGRGEVHETDQETTDGIHEALLAKALAQKEEEDKKSLKSDEDNVNDLLSELLDESDDEAKHYRANRRKKDKNNKSNNMQRGSTKVKAEPTEEYSDEGEEGVEPLDESVKGNPIADPPEEANNVNDDDDDDGFAAKWKARSRKKHILVKRQLNVDPNFKGLRVQGDELLSKRNCFFNNISFKPFDLMKQVTSIPQWEPSQDADEDETYPLSSGDDELWAEGDENVETDDKNDMGDLAFLYQTNDFYNDEWRTWPTLEIVKHFPWAKFFETEEKPTMGEIQKEETELDKRARVLAEQKKALESKKKKKETSEDQWKLLRTAMLIGNTWREDRKKRYARSHLVETLELRVRFGPELKGYQPGLVGLCTQTGQVLAKQYSYYRFYVHDSDTMLTIEVKNAPQADLFVSTSVLPNITDYDWRSETVGESKVILVPEDGKFVEGWYFVGVYTMLAMSFTLHLEQAGVNFISDALANVAKLTKKFQSINGAMSGGGDGRHSTDSIRDQTSPARKKQSRSTNSIRGSSRSGRHSKSQSEIQQSPTAASSNFKRDTQFKLSIAEQSHSDLVTEQEKDVENLRYELIAVDKEIREVDRRTTRAKLFALAGKPAVVKLKEIDENPDFGRTMVKLSNKRRPSGSHTRTERRSSSVANGFGGQVVAAVGADGEIHNVDAATSKAGAHHEMHLMREQSRRRTGETAGQQNSNDSNDEFWSDDDDDDDETLEEFSSESEWETESLPLTPRPESERVKQGIKRLLRTTKLIRYDPGDLHLFDDVATRRSGDTDSTTPRFDFDSISDLEVHMKRCRSIFQAAVRDTSNPHGTLDTSTLGQVLRSAGLEVRDQLARKWMSKNEWRLKDGIDLKLFLEAVGEITKSKRVSESLRAKLADKSISLETDADEIDQEVAKRKKQHEHGLPVRTAPNVKKDSRYEDGGDEVLHMGTTYVLKRRAAVQLAIGPKSGCDIGHVPSPRKARFRIPDLYAKYRRSPEKLAATRRKAHNRVIRMETQSRRTALLMSRLSEAARREMEATGNMIVW